MKATNADFDHGSLPNFIKVSLVPSHQTHHRFCKYTNGHGVYLEDEYRWWKSGSAYARRLGTCAENYSRRKDVIYESWMRQGIFKVPLTGGEPLQLISGSAFEPSVSPDGKLLAVTKRRHEPPDS
jgi:hypothetical protein